MTSFLDALIRPRSVAIVGASDDPAKTAGRPQRYLAKHGYTGRVYPVNPGRAEVQGAKAWPSLAALPEVVDHAYIVLGTEPAIQAVEACAAAGIRTVSMLADGFAEDGAAGEARQRRLSAVVEAAGLRLLGPNSMGVISPAGGCTLTVNAALDADSLLPGRLMAISQSGSLIGTFLSRGQVRGIGFHSLLSVGNEADLTVGDIGLAAVDDPGVDAFLLFLETIRKPAALAAFARAAHRAGKPVVAYKLGRSDAGRELAVSHTGAIVGSDAAADAFCRAHGIVRVDHFETLLEIPPMLIGRRPDPARRGRPVAVVTTTGGGGAMVIDRLGALGIEVEGAPDAVKAALAPKGIHLRPGRLTDVTLAGARYDTMMTALTALLDCGAFSTVVATVGSSAQFHPGLAVQPIVDCKGHATPLAGFIVPQADASLAMLGAAGVPGFRTAECCADAVAAFLDWPVPAAEVAVTAPALDLPDAGGVLTEAESLRLFKALGVTVAETVVLAPDGPVPDGIAYPVAAKVLSADVPHKTEAGGVVLNVADAAGLEAARTRILASVRAHVPGARVDGIAVQPMAAGLAEALVGYRLDPEVGPVVTVALGGVLAEIYADAAVRLAPVDRATARGMVLAVKGLATVRGYRGLPKGDIESLAAAVEALSSLALVPRVLEAEINPMIVRAEGAGVIAVDGLVRVAGR